MHTLLRIGPSESIPRVDESKKEKGGKPLVPLPEKGVQKPTEVQPHEYQHLSEGRLKETSDAAKTVMELVDSAATVTDIKDLVGFHLSTSKDLLKTIILILNAIPKIDLPEKPVAGALDFLHGVNAGIGWFQLAAILMKLIIVRKAESWISDHANEFSREEVEKTQQYLAEQKKSLKEAAVVALISSGCSTFEFIADFLDLMGVKSPIFTVGGWVVLNIYIGLSVYAVCCALKPLKKQKEWMDREFPKFDIRLNYPTPKEIAKLTKEKIDHLTPQEIANFAKAAVKRLEKGTLSQVSKQKVASLEKQLGVKLDKKVIKQFKQNALKQLLALQKDHPVKLSKKEIRLLKNAVIKSMEKEAIQELREKKSDPRNIAVERMAKLLSKRKEAFDTKLQGSKEEFDNFVHSLFSLPSDEIEKDLTAKGIHMEHFDATIEKKRNVKTIDDLKGLFTPEQIIGHLKDLQQLYLQNHKFVPEATRNQLDQLILDLSTEKSTQDFWNMMKSAKVASEDMPGVIFKKYLLQGVMQNMKEAHQAYVKHLETMDITVKNILKEWTARQMKIERPFLKFALGKEITGLAVLSLFVIILATLTILSTAGVIACPPVVIGLLTAGLLASSVALVAIGLIVIAHKKPNLFETYFNGEYLNHLLAQANHKISIIRYWKTISEVSVGMLNPSFKATPTQVEVFKTLSEMDEYAKHCKRQIDDAAWRDTVREIESGTEYKAIKEDPERYLKQLTQALLPDDPKMLDKLDYKAIKDNLKHYMGIKLPQIEPHATKEEIVELVTNEIRLFLSH